MSAGLCAARKIARIPCGRIFVREAGVDPLIRVMVEGKSFEKINKYAIEISEKIKEQTSREPVLNITK